MARKSHLRDTPYTLHVKKSKKGQKKYSKGIKVQTRTAYGQQMKSKPGDSRVLNAVLSF